jgi:hypothetical protein
MAHPYVWFPCLWISACTATIGWSRLQGAKLLANGVWVHSLCLEICPRQDLGFLLEGGDVAEVGLLALLMLTMASDDPLSVPGI